MSSNFNVRHGTVIHVVYVIPCSLWSQIFSTESNIDSFKVISHHILRSNKGLICLLNVYVLRELLFSIGRGGRLFVGGGGPEFFGVLPKEI